MFQYFRDYSNTTKLRTITTKLMMSLTRIELGGEDNDHSFQPPQTNLIDKKILIQ